MAGNRSADPRLPDRPLQFVLDTNVALDWLVFADPALRQLDQAVETGRLAIVTHTVAIEELRRVLSYRELKLDAAAQESTLQRYLKQSRKVLIEDVLLADRASLPRGFPRCEDRDDEPFLALAYHARADALVSRDNAVLALSRKIREFGFTILNPRQMNETLQP